MKKYLYSIVFATLILLSTTAVKASSEAYYINKKNIEMTEVEYNNLLRLGFTEKNIATMGQEEFDENKNLQGNVLSENKKYYRITTVLRNGMRSTSKTEITKEEALEEARLQSQNPNKGPAPGSYYDGIVLTGIISITAKIVGINSTTMRFMNITEWVTIPSERYYDIIAVGMEPGKVQSGSLIAFRVNWTTTGGVDGEETVCTPKYESTGGSAIFGLPSGSLTDLDALLYYNVNKKPNVGTITSLYAVASYAHGTSTVNTTNLSNNYTVNIANGIELYYPYNTIYDTYPTAVAHFVGTW